MVELIVVITVVVVLWLAQYINTKPPTKHSEAPPTNNVRKSQSSVLSRVNWKYIFLPVVIIGAVFFTEDIVNFDWTSVSLGRAVEKELGADSVKWIWPGLTISVIVLVVMLTGKGSSGLDTILWIGFVFVVIWQLGKLLVTEFNPDEKFEIANQRVGCQWYSDYREDVSTTIPQWPGRCIRFRKAREAVVKFYAKSNCWVAVSLVDKHPAMTVHDILTKLPHKSGRDGADGKSFEVNNGILRKYGLGIVDIKVWSVCQSSRSSFVPAPKKAKT